MNTRQKSCFKAGLFDWNGSLFDDVAVNHEFANKASREFGNGRQLSIAEYRENIALNYFELYQLLGISPDSMRKKVFAAREKFMRENWHRTKLRPDVRELLIVCKSLGLYTAIVSAEHSSLLLDRIDVLDIGRYLDAMFPETDDKESAFFAICKKQRIKTARRAFYVDDTPDGVACGKRAGLTTFGFTNGHASVERMEDAEPDKLINSIADMIPIVRAGLFS